MDAIDRALLAGLRAAARETGGVVGPEEVNGIGAALGLDAPALLDRIEVLHANGRLDLPGGGVVRPKEAVQDGIEHHYHAPKYQIGSVGAGSAVGDGATVNNRTGLDEAALGRLVLLLRELKEARAADAHALPEAVQAEKAVGDLVRAEPEAAKPSAERALATVEAVNRSVDATTKLGATLSRIYETIMSLGG